MSSTAKLIITVFCIAGFLLLSTSYSNFGFLIFIVALSIMV